MIHVYKSNCTRAFTSSIFLVSSWLILQINSDDHCIHYAKRCSQIEYLYDSLNVSLVYENCFLYELGWMSCTIRDKRTNLAFSELSVEAEPSMYTSFHFVWMHIHYLCPTSPTCRVSQIEQRQELGCLVKWGTCAASKEKVHSEFSLAKYGPSMKASYIYLVFCRHNHHSRD